MRYRAGGAPITCPCCQHDDFRLDYKKLNTTGMSLFGLDWANKDAAILICERCTHILWFMSKPDSKD